MSHVKPHVKSHVKLKKCPLWPVNFRVSRPCYNEHNYVFFSAIGAWPAWAGSNVFVRVMDRHRLQPAVIRWGSVVPWLSLVRLECAARRAGDGSGIGPLVQGAGRALHQPQPAARTGSQGRLWQGYPLTEAQSTWSILNSDTIASKGG